MKVKGEHQIEGQAIGRRLRLISKSLVLLGKSIYTFYNRGIRYCAVVAALAIVMTMLTTVSDVIARGIKIPIVGIFELNSLLVGASIYLAIAFTQREKKNITVKLLTVRLPKRVAAILDIPLLIICAVLFGWSSYLYYGRASTALAINEVAEGITRFPLFPLRVVMLLGLSLLTIQLVTDIIRRALEIVTPTGKKARIGGE